MDLLEQKDIDSTDEQKKWYPVRSSNAQVQETTNKLPILSKRRK